MWLDTSHRIDYGNRWIFRRSGTWQKTTNHLYRSVMDESFTINVGEYPGDGVLDPRWQDTSYIDRKGNTRISRADVRVRGSEVEPVGGTSLHDVPRWYSAPDFWIPEGTEYSEADIHIHRDDDLRTSPYNRKLSGYHYQLEPKFKMPVLAFKGALNNMARAAVVRQIALAGSKAKA
ncbi:MAG: hypothetical protein ABI197_04050 [Granulicella sp.]